MSRLPELREIVQSKAWGSAGKGAHFVCATAARTVLTTQYHAKLRIGAKIYAQASQ